MDVKKIDEILSKLDESIIKKIDFDPLKHEISFDLLPFEGNNQVKKKIIFKDFSAVFFMNDSGSERFDFIPFDPNNRLKLTSTPYYPQTLEPFLFPMTKSFG